MLVTADPAGRQELAAALEVNGFRVDVISRFEEACARVPILSPDLILADIDTLQDPELSNKCQKLVRCSDQGRAAAPVIILGGVERFALTAELMEAGANDFLTGPFLIPDFICRIEIALVASKFTGVGDPASKSNSREGHGAGLAPRRARPYGATKPLCDTTANETAAEPFDDMLIGRGEAFARVISQVRLVAPKDTTVLIMGETGTGKERVARAIHMLSDRGNRDMVSRLTAAESRRTCSRMNSSAMSREPSPTPIKIGSAASSRLIEARSFSMRSGICHSSCSPNYCE